MACSAVRREAGEFLESAKGVVRTGLQVTHNKAILYVPASSRSNAMDLRDLGSPPGEVNSANGQVETAALIRRNGLRYMKDQ